MKTLQNYFSAELVDQFQQAIGIPMGIHCVLLLADLFYRLTMPTSFMGFSRINKQN